jgi:uncharacterized protein (DUF58 family)
MNSRLIFLLLGAVAAWIIALNTGRELAFSLAYLLTGIVLVSYFWAWNSVRGVTARRRTKLWLEIDDFSTLPWHSASRVVSAVRRNGTQRWLVKTLCMQRGRFRLGPVTLRSGDPLGVFRRERPLSGTGYVIVYPPTVEITAFEPSVSQLSGGEARHRRTYQVTSSVAGVREYVTGDGFNRIHWPTTARLNRLMVKEFELDPTADVWIYLDLCSSAAAALPWSPPQPEAPIFSAARHRARGVLELPPSTTEYGVTIAASLARYFILRNRAVGMNSRGRTREFVQSDRGERQLHKFFEALAVVEAAGDLPFADLVVTDGIRLNRNDMLLAITADADPSWVAALQMLQRRGVNSVAILLDATTFGSQRSYDRVQGELLASGISLYRIRREDDLSTALAAPLQVESAR